MSQEEEKRNPTEELEIKIADNAANEQEIRATLSQAEGSVQNTEDAVTAIKVTVDDVYRTFNDAREKMRYAGWIVPLAMAILYSIYSYYVGLPLNAILFGEVFIVPSLIIGLQFVAYILKIKPTTVYTTGLRNTLAQFRVIAGNLTTVVGTFVSGASGIPHLKEVIQNRQRFVRTLRNSLALYGFKLSDKIESYLDGFPSFSDNEDDWLEEVSNSLSRKLGVPQAIFKLAYADFSNDDPARKNAWGSIRDSESILGQFVTLLVDRNLFDLSSTYRQSPKLTIEFISKRQASSDDFSLSTAKTTISHSFALIDSEKGDFLRTLWANHIPLPQGDRDEFSMLLPTQELHSTLLIWLEKRTMVQSCVLQLFFLDYRALVRERDDYFSELKRDKNRIASLSKELLSRQIISIVQPDEKRKERDIANLTAYLEGITGYDKVEIGSVFSRYNRLFETSTSILAFLKDQSICRNEAELSFENLLTMVTPDVDFLTQLEVATQASIEKYSSYSSNTEWLKPGTLAAMTIFLVDGEDLFLRGDACRRVANVDLTVKILYEYSWINDEEQDKIAADKTLLDGIIRRVMNGETHSEVYLPEFIHSLSTGRLCKRIKEIPNTVFRHTDELMDFLSKQVEFKTKLEQHVNALTTVLDTQLDTETIMESLKMQLVGAYALTVPTGADVLGSVVARLPEACKDLAATDSRYYGLVLESEARSVSFGRHVRLGIVPFRMDFMEFTGLLENVYRSALAKYQESGQMSHPVDDYLANITRIFPTSAYFLQLAMERKKGDDFLAKFLRPLMIEKFGSVRTLEIIASLKKTSEGTVALKSMLANLYDDNSRIYLIDRDRFDAVLSGSKLTPYFKEGSLDRDLVEKFNKQKLSDLAIMVHRSGQTVLRNLQKHIADICHEIRAGTNETEIVDVSKIIFDALDDVGMILDNLSQTKTPA